MKTFYSPVHFYERDGYDDDLVMIITQRNHENHEIQSKIEAIKTRLLITKNDFESPEDMVDAIFNQLAEEVDCIWCYCQPLETLVIGDPRDEDLSDMTGDLEKVSIGQLARILLRLNPGDNIYFYESCDDDEGCSGHIFCATLIKRYESYAIYINCQGGGLPFISGITEYYQDLKKQKLELTEYFQNIENFDGHVYIDSSLVVDDFDDE